MYTFYVILSTTINFKQPQQHHSQQHHAQQQQHTGSVKKCTYHGNNLAMLSFRNNVILIKSNVRNIKA